MLTNESAKPRGAFVSGAGEGAQYAHSPATVNRLEFQNKPGL